MSPIGDVQEPLLADPVLPRCETVLGSSVALNNVDTSSNAQLVAPVAQAEAKI